MKPNSGINKIKPAVLVALAMAVLLFAGGTAFAQTHAGYRTGVTQQPHRGQRWYATPVAPHRQLHNPFTYRRPQSYGVVDRYGSSYGQYGPYGYPHYGPGPGTYGSHYGYYSRPYVRWSPHYGGGHHSLRRH